MVTEGCVSSYDLRRDEEASNKEHPLQVSREAGNNYQLAGITRGNGADGDEEELLVGDALVARLLPVHGAPRTAIDIQWCRRHRRHLLTHSNRYQLLTLYSSAKYGIAIAQCFFTHATGSPCEEVLRRGWQLLYIHTQIDTHAIAS